jgi:2-polyprenyl-6-hydroxyphenyl methylase/3-demethylubiquinone-9 3-methyltransferase
VPTGRLTDERYWSTLWRGRRAGGSRFWGLDGAIRQQARLIDGLVDRLGHEHRPVRVLEVGCADSLWLPYLARQRDVVVEGVDFSPDGCRQAEDQLARASASGTIHCADFFGWAPAHAASCDLIVSFGFIEHFDDPADPLRAMYTALRPGGLVLATVPNIVGIYGPLQRLINPEPLDHHVVLDAADLRACAGNAGFAEVDAGYVGGGLYFGVLNFKPAHDVVRRGLRIVDLANGWAQERLGLRLNQRFTSPYAYVIGRRPAG